MPEQLKDRLQHDLTDAIRARDQLTSSTLRMALTSVRSEEVAGSTARTLAEPEVIAVLGREAKKRREAAAAYDDAGRGELAARERDELGVLERYLPTQLPDDELAALVAEAVAEQSGAGRSGMSAMGAVMKTVQPRVAGRAEGGRVAAEVRRQLTSS